MTAEEIIIFSSIVVFVIIIFLMIWFSDKFEEND